MSRTTANISKLVGLLKNRLQSAGKAKSLDAAGNTVYIDVDIYSPAMLEAFVELSISSFNQTPHFSFFTAEDSPFVDTFAEVLVEGATLYALSSQALIERGREFQMTDTGISFSPPSIAEMLNTQFSIILSHHWEKLKVIKSYMDTDSQQSFKK